MWVGEGIALSMNVGDNKGTGEGSGVCADVGVAVSVCEWCVYRSSTEAECGGCGCDCGYACERLVLTV